MTIPVLALTKSTGGIALYHRMLVAALDPARFRIHTLCLSENGPAYATDLQALGHTAEAIPMARYSIDPTGDLRVMRHVRDAARRQKAAVILCHGSKAGYIGRAVGRFAGIPSVYCQASLPFLRRVQGRKAPVYWALEYAARGFGGQIVALTEAARNATITHHLAAPDRISVIRTGIDTERFRPRGRRDQVVADLGLDPARPVIGWLGRLEPQKDPECFVRALGPLLQAHPAVQVVIAGEGRLHPEIAARLAGDGLTDRVRLLPWQTDPARTLEGFDLFAMSSRWEGLPLTLLEAMASGCIPVSTDVDGCAEVIEDGVSGRLVPAERPDRMAAALGDLLAGQADWPQMAQAARARVDTCFNRARMIAEWGDLLARLAATGARGA